MTLRTVLWDNDGVLVDTERLWLRATRETLATVGVLLTTEAFVRISLTEGQSAFGLAVAQGVRPEEIPRLRSVRDARYLRLLEEGAPVLDGVEDALRSLRRDVSMGIVTSSRRDHFEAAHRESGLLEHFDFVLTREDYRRTKPHPDPYVAAIERWGLRREECVVVEDSPRGLLAARRAALRCIVVPNPLVRNGAFEGAHRIVASARDAAEEIRRLAALRSPARSRRH